MRASGILLHISSLSSPYGIGTLGKEAFDFIDFLKNSGQSYWQMLPIGPTSYGDSPYQSFSSFAGNPYFIDFRILTKQGLLKKSDYHNIDWGDDPEKVDYGKLYKNRFKVLRIAYQNFIKNIPDDFDKFCNDNAFWLHDFALFMALKDENGGKAWESWPKPLVIRELHELEIAEKRLKNDILFYKMQQYLFYSQWNDVRSYAHKNGISIIGDLPIYVAKDSADVWSEPQQFQLDKDYNCTAVAGCPPDAFSDDGQLWGNPLYDWQFMKKDGYSWWCRRMEYYHKLFDIIRIDHFRGFDSYFSIPAADKTAKNGKWKKGPGMALFRAIRKTLGEIPIIAEDLGYLTPSVRKLLKDSGYPGMKVLQFAFDSREESNYLPHLYPKNCVVYTGTHDNDTILGWIETAPSEDVKFAKQYMRLNDLEGYNWGMMKTALASEADTAILMMQDFLGLGSFARMNTPSTLGGNWQWRVKGECLNPWLSEIIYENVKVYSRLPKE